MTRPIFTIGHSNRSLDDFVALLRESRIERLVDVRTIPRSRFNPQFNTDTLPGELAVFDISYEHVAALGGRRRKSPDVPRDVNAFWTHESFHNYADYALSDEFRAGLSELIALAGERRCAMMCAEAVWWRCHRRIVADYLLQRGHEVFHLMGEDRVDPAKLTPAAIPAEDGLHYPAAA